MNPDVTLKRYTGVPVAVLGADGFIGRWVARALSEAGADLHLVVLRRSEAEPVLAAYSIRGQVHEADLTDLEGTRRMLSGLAPAVVFNLVGYGVAPEEKRAASTRLAELLNVQLPGAIAEALAVCPTTGWGGRRIVHAGSVFEYGNIGGDLAESSVPVPHGLYGTSKLRGTRQLAESCLAGGVSGLTVRLCQVYGPGEHPGRLLPLLFEARRTGTLEPLTSGTQEKDFTYVEDVAEGMLRLGTTTGPPGEIVNLATGRLMPVRDFALLAAHLLRLDIGLLRFEKPLPDNELRHSEVAVGRLRQLTGWIPPTTAAAGILKTLAFLEHPGHE